MSRLQRHQKKQFTLTIIIFALLFVLVLAFIGTIGLKLLFQSSIFVADLTRPKNDPASNSNQNIVASQINIYDIPVSTNSARIIIKGSAPNYKKLLFYINDNKVKEVILTKDAFTQEIGDLRDGENEVYILGIRKENAKEKQTQNYTVLFKKEKPKLEIKTPADKSTVNNQEINIEGQTDKEVYVKVNSLPVVLNADGSFRTSVRLSEGENKINVEVQDIAGNTEKKEVTVTYSKD